MRKIQTKAGDIKWTKVALSYLQERYTKTQLRHIARKLGVPAYTVRRKLLELGLQEPNNPFSPKEVQFILDNYQKYSYREIATELGKTFKQVRNQSILLGIKKTEKVHPHHLRIPYKTKKYVLDNYYAKTYKQIATELGIALQSVCRIVRLLKQEGKITKSKGKWTPPKGGKTFYINKTPTKTSFKTERERKNYVKQVEKDLFSEFEDELRAMKVSEGRILIKLLDRETGNSSFEIIKEFKGGFSAFFWQSVAKLFGHDLKAQYDPATEDRLIEYIIVQIDLGLI